MLGVDRTEVIKWWDVLDLLDVRQSGSDVEGALQMARACRHPHAQWLASLFPVGVAATHESMHEVMMGRKEDPRAQCLAWLVERHQRGPSVELVRAGKAGYAPAQAVLSWCCERDEQAQAFEWARRASAQGNRRGMYQLSRCLRTELGCTVDLKKSMELLRAPADLEDRRAQHKFGILAFGELDWERITGAVGRLLGNSTVRVLLRRSRSAPLV
jgi:TPR repeat protein